MAEDEISIVLCLNCGCAFQDPGVSIANSPICNGTLLFMTLLEAFLIGRCDISDPCRRIVGTEDSADEYDFIVVGAGAAGSIVAARLAEIDNYKVLLLEAGGPDPVASRVPSFYRSFWSDVDVDWGYRTVPDEDYCLSEQGKGCKWIRGKTVGGSSVLNGMMYHRGHAADYQDWVNFGAEGWSWEENLPYFFRTEDNRQIGTLVSSEYHATGGPLPVQQFRYQPKAAFDILQAVAEAGFPVINDINDPTTPDGFAIAQTYNDDGQRYSTARAFLKPRTERPNLYVKVNAQVTKVLLNGTQATGVQYVQNGVTKTATATKEVILSAGALNSPHILLLSGIGPQETLQKFDIPVVADLPVGQNLRNHIGMSLYFLLEKVEDTQTLDWVASTEYLLNRSGPMSGNGITQVTGILYSSLANTTSGQPDLQFFFNDFYAECSATGAVGEPVTDCPQNGKNISITAVNLLPRSVGYLTLNSTDPFDPPLFYPAYFSHPEDMLLVKEGARFVQKIVETETLKEGYGIKLDSSYSYVCNASGAEWSDEWLECMTRVYTDPQNHQLGTAAISRVIDTRLRVFNVTGLRVIDASSMPTQPTGNPQAAIMMVAEKGAQMIKDDWSTSQAA